MKPTSCPNMHGSLGKLEKKHLISSFIVFKRDTSVEKKQKIAEEIPNKYYFYFEKYFGNYIIISEYYDVVEFAKKHSDAIQRIEYVDYKPTSGIVVVMNHKNGLKIEMKGE